MKENEPQLTAALEGTDGHEHDYDYFLCGGRTYRECIFCEVVEEVDGRAGTPQVRRFSIGREAYEAALAEGKSEADAVQAAREAVARRSRLPHTAHANVVALLVGGCLLVAV